MDSHQTIKIRLAEKTDIPAIVAIEKHVYKDTGCAPFSEDHVNCWLNTHPEGFFVAERHGAVQAFTYMQLINFDPDKGMPFTTYDRLTDHGYSRATHQPDGNAFCTITMDSCSPAAGILLFKHALKNVGERGKMFGIGTSRISGFNAYLEKIHNLGIINRHLLDKDAKMKIAHWYAEQTVKRLRGTTESTCPAAPWIDLPPPEKADPVLGFYIGHRLAMHSIYPDFLEDAQSHNFSVIVVHRSIHCR